MKESKVKDKRVNVFSDNQEHERATEEQRNSVERLRGFEALGINKENDVHEALIDRIEFPGERYKVSLPWKERHSILPSNSKLSLRRLKGKMDRLRKEPEILQEYNRIIVEKVSTLDNAQRVYYLPHYAVVRNEAKSSKVRILCDETARS